MNTIEVDIDDKVEIVGQDTDMAVAVDVRPPRKLGCDAIFNGE